MVPEGPSEVSRTCAASEIKFTRFRASASNLIASALIRLPCAQRRRTCCHVSVLVAWTTSWVCSSASTNFRSESWKRLVFSNRKVMLSGRLSLKRSLRTLSSCLLSLLQ
jgi:hypothetical protein